MTKLTVIIFALPVALIVTITHLLVIVLSDNCGTVVSKTPRCVEIGKDVLSKGGSAVDAAIAVMFCEGVHGPKEIGLGGGFTALLYVEGRVRSLTATPTTPENAPIDEINSQKPLKPSMTGGIPGELLGYWEMHREYGLLEWKKLVEPSLKLCENGVNILDSQFVLANRKRKRGIMPKMTLYPENVKGILKLPALAKTLRQIANKGASVFYDGELGEAFVKDVQEAGGVLTMNDLRNYNVSWSWDVVSFYLPHKLKAYTTPLPSSGVIVALAMSIIKGWKDFEEPIFWHHFVEAIKHALGLGLTLGDWEHESNATTAKYIKETYKQMLNIDFARKLRDKISYSHAANVSKAYGCNFHHHQTDSEFSLHVAVLAPNGDAISLTSSLRWPIGTAVFSKRTGIYWNDRLRSYSLLEGIDIPPARLASPWKRSLMPHAPVIVFPLFQDNPHLVLGAMGGPHMPAQIITVLTKFYLQGRTTYDAMDTGYLLPQLYQQWIEYEYNSPKKVVDYLGNVGHRLKFVGDRLRRYGTVAILSINGWPVPRISARNLTNDLFVCPTTSMDSLYGYLLICVEIMLLGFLANDYIQAKRSVGRVKESIALLPYSNSFVRL